MKKTYKTPEMNIVKIDVAPMLAGSPVYGNQTTETSGNLAPEFEGYWD